MYLPLTEATIYWHCEFYCSIIFLLIYCLFHTQKVCEKIYLCITVKSISRQNRVQSTNLDIKTDIKTIYPKFEFLERLETGLSSYEVQCSVI